MAALPIVGLFQDIKKHLDLDLPQIPYAHRMKSGSRSRSRSRSRPMNSKDNVLILLTVLVLATVTVSSSRSKTKPCLDCDQGKCVNGTCVCHPGWRGLLCDQCYGRIRLQPGKAGIIHDGATNYSKDLSCSWLLDAGQDGLRVQFELNSFATECTWDHLYIHNGDSAFAPLVAAFSGIAENASGKPRLKFQLTGRYVFIHFYSDAAFVLPGFNISYMFDDCDLDCSDKGVCNNGICECEPGWSGKNCEVVVEGCLFNCSQHGRCVQGKCHCETGFRGQFCDINDGEIFVDDMTIDGPLKPMGRASASLVYDGSDSLWLFGGYKMRNKQINNEIYRFLLKNNTWIIVNEDTSKSNPWPRYGHSVVYYKGKFFLFGGVSGEVVKSDLWSFDGNTFSWTELKQSPRDLVGHTAHVVNDMMVVIFGYSSHFGYSNKLFEYNFDEERWTVLKTSGALVLGGYGHSSTYDVQRNKIYVYGGYHSLSSSHYNLTDRLYQYDPITKEWFILANSGSARYLHSAAMMNGLMITFGGSTHSDAQRGEQAKCFSSHLKVYDRDCNSWHTQPLETIGNHVMLDRVGQSMVSFNNEVYMFGGFNSVLMNDLYKILPGNCSHFRDKDSCDRALSGIKCTWRGGLCEISQGGENSCVKKDGSALCSGYNTCQSCLGSQVSSCSWCGGQCISPEANTANCSKDTSICTKAIDQYCGMQQNCLSCQDEYECLWKDKKCVSRQSRSCAEHKTCLECRKVTRCGWCVDQSINEVGSCVDGREDDPRIPSSACKYQWFYNECPATKSKPASVEKICPKKPCSAQTSCFNCTDAECMWCSNKNQCIDTNSYVTFFHYGQCMDWTTRKETCNESDCSQHKSCTECQAVPKCGWCSDGTNTGTGTCYDGSMHGPMVHINSSSIVDTNICPTERWHFNDCPKCQCNGHSTCINNTSICKSCESPTTGPQCQFCSNGFYGVPKHGGSCRACFCNDQADTCDHVTGACYCRTRGVIGVNCESCDDKNKYTGNPKNGGTCYYRLITDFQYTFNLSKPEDQNYTTINFLNTPTSSDRDVDFTLNCSSTAFINITYKSKSFPEENEYVSGRLCDYFRSKFEHKKHAFGGKENTTFMVYVYDFKTPFLLQISFVQQEKINLYKFFIIFFSCFLALILLVAAAWKIKHKVESYRRGRRLEVEMQQMARRPFSTIAVEIEKKSNPVVLDRKDHIDSVLRRRKKMGSKPSSIALEPLKDNKAAILTLLIQLPTGSSDYAPSGISGLAVGSALVSIGSNRKQSLDHIKGERPKIRKNLSYPHPDVCA